MTDAFAFEPGETVRWEGRPYWTVVLPAAAVGLAFAVTGLALAGLGVPDGGPPMLVWSGGLVLVGLSVPAASYLRVVHTRYAVTDRAVYRKTGVLSRSVTRVPLERVQDSAYAQSIRGRLFGYGSIVVEVAGGGAVRFERIEEPQAVRELLDRVTAGETVPGSVEQWEAVLEEVRAIRRAIERRDGRQAG